ncbi:hypothetical protein G9A89_003426 [Geosiphon pyriformis]|nr:hypothetical protein G9A89_003426 [Geosiphon pyriformis]
MNIELPIVKERQTEPFLAYTKENRISAPSSFQFELSCAKTQWNSDKVFDCPDYANKVTKNSTTNTYKGVFLPYKQKFGDDDDSEGTDLHSLLISIRVTDPLKLDQLSFIKMQVLDADFNEDILNPKFDQFLTTIYALNTYYLINGQVNLFGYSKVRREILPQNPIAFSRKRVSIPYITSSLGAHRLQPWGLVQKFCGTRKISGQFDLRKSLSIIPLIPKQSSNQNLNPQEISQRLDDLELILREYVVDASHLVNINRIPIANQQTNLATQNPTSLEKDPNMSVFVDEFGVWQPNGARTSSSIAT